MYQTTYHRASSLEDAAKLHAGGDDPKFVAGGMTLIPAMKTRLSAPSDLIDLRHIDGMKGIRISGQQVEIGALTTHADLAQSKELEKACHSLHYMANHVGDPLVRHLGTMGGCVANNDPAQDYPAALLALDATIITTSREMKADDFFTGLFETALEEGEIVKAVRFTAPDQCGYEKFRNPASRYAMTGVFVAKGAGGVRVAVTGAGDNGVYRETEMEEKLAANFSADALEGVTVSPSNMMSDIHASAEYRANLVVVMAKRAVAKAAGH
ncbi:carbon monoxide dehydrogenase [Aliihoeflea aestuarii]|uniref:FAD binding domain-containing protein n=1 Tax=Aliihoeflea aestuarii TaxID=453840 RepID=UPI0020936781|nr:xanthine dehydrogenase family protein subunit M [Aliihoeflea aestuarii]MCO6389875.1 carbon monoxide dehydrogenase [Aliihoeflea aestuarii]